MWAAIGGSLAILYGLQWLASQIKSRYQVGNHLVKWMRDNMFYAFCLLFFGLIISVYTNILSIDLVIRKKTGNLPFAVSTLM